MRTKTALRQALVLVGLCLVLCASRSQADESKPAAMDEEGFTPLLDAAQAAEWAQAGAGGFKLEAGVARPDGGAGLWYYKKPLANFILKLEFRQGKADASSAVLLRVPEEINDPSAAAQKGYAVRIHGSGTAKDSTGAIDGLQEPKTAAGKPAGEWNDLLVAATGQRYTVLVNGRLVNTFAGDRAAKGMIALQNAGESVEFRNVRIEELPDTAIAYHVLFDGTEPQGWKQASPGAFEVKDGLLVSNGQGMGLYYHEKSFGDFILSLDYKTEKKEDDSGIFLRVPEKPEDAWSVVDASYEVQICDSDQRPNYHTGALVNAKAPDESQLVIHDLGQWNHYEISVTGQNYVVKLNGKTIVEFTGHKAISGCIGIQEMENFHVAFRNIHVVELQRDESKLPVEGL